MRYCPECGFECDIEEALFCPFCAEELEEKAVDGSLSKDEELSPEDLVLALEPFEYESLPEGGYVIKKIKNTATSQIAIPYGVIRIDHHACEECRNALRIILPSSLRSIGEQAFCHCTSVESITIPEGVVDIDYAAFRFCHALSEISIPKSLKEIPSSGFTNCSLTEITIPEGVEYVGTDAFYECDMIESVSLPSTVTVIHDGAFSQCNGIKQFTVAKDNPAFRDIEGDLYTKDGKTLLQYALGKSEGTFTLPDGVTKVGNAAFYACEKLARIILPSSLTEVELSAFGYCPSLTEVFYKGNKKEWKRIRIDNCNGMNNPLLKAKINFEYKD